MTARSELDMAVEGLARCVGGMLRLDEKDARYRELEDMAVECAKRVRSATWRALDAGWD